MRNYFTTDVNPFGTAVPFWGQTSQILSSLSPKRDSGSKGVKRRTWYFPDGGQTRYLWVSLSSRPDIKEKEAQLCLPNGYHFMACLGHCMPLFFGSLLFFRSAIQEVKIHLLKGGTPGKRFHCAPGNRGKNPSSYIDPGFAAARKG